MSDIARRLAILLWGVVLAAPCFAQDAHRILSELDRRRSLDPSFRVTNTLQEYVDGVARDSSTVVVYARADGATGQFDTLVRFADPPRDSGKLVLLDAEKMWFYDPASRAIIRISPQERLLGQASNGDVVNENLATNYSGTVAGPEDIEDTDHRSRHCWHLDLRAANEHAVYSRVEYWIEESTYRPVKGRYYTDSGRLLKIAYFTHFAAGDEAVRANETIIIDALNPKLITTMTLSDYLKADVPATWFERDYLPHVKASD